jgi:sulfoxide reductase catalytic subunit YedY
MANIILKPEWHIAERHVTPEAIYANRRSFLRQMGLTGAGLFTAQAAFLSARAAEAAAKAGAASAVKYPAKRNPDFDPKLRLSEQEPATSYNNFYEFSTSKDRVKRLVGNFKTEPWPLEIYGLCEKPLKLDLNELLAEFPVEERVYRFRCVEAWSMVVPWTGFQLSELLKKVQPKAEAKFVRFETVARPEEMPGYNRLLAQGYPMPYNEGLRLDEAMNPLTLVTTGIYGKPLPKQNGAPVRIVVPWKYGYKSIKSIVKIELVAKQPATLWETLQPQEYPFESNVDPGVPHPRWSQATEREVDTGDRIPTLLYNGYEAQVAKLYKKG